MLQRITERGRETYSVRLERTTEDNVIQDDKFQWLMAMDRIDEHEILNRPWQAVGPIFPTRDKGSKWLGFSEAHNNDADAGKHREEVIEEYNALFNDEPLGKHYINFERKSFAKQGRPSQNRAARLQAAVTPELAQWIATQKQSTDTTSDVVFRLLEELKNQQSSDALSASGE